MEAKSIKIPNKTTSIDLVTIASNFHIEMNPSDSGMHYNYTPRTCTPLTFAVGHQDRVVVQEVIKEIAMSPPINAQTKKPFKGKCIPYNTDD